MRLQVLLLLNDRITSSICYDEDVNDKETLAAEAWQRMFGFFMATRPQRDAVLERLELTPNDARTITTLDAKQGRTMRSRADEWGCDASNATFMVDRLERRGLVRRRVLATDRRVKHVVLTTKGLELKQDLLASMNEAPAALRELSLDELQTLVTSLQKLPFNVAPGPTRTDDASTETKPLPRRRLRRAE
jgi:DNA-binding MarR family transcriptional regulator